MGRRDPRRGWTGPLAAVVGGLAVGTLAFVQAAPATGADAALPDGLRRLRAEAACRSEVAQRVGTSTFGPWNTYVGRTAYRIEGAVRVLGGTPAGAEVPYRCDVRYGGDVTSVVVAGRR